jgi:hypothetical protein
MNLNTTICKTPSSGVLKNSPSAGVLRGGAVPFSVLKYNPTFYLSSTNPNTNVFSDGAVQFTASDKAYLSIASNATLNLETGDFAFNIWFLRGATGAKVFATKYQDANNYWEFGVNSSNIPYFTAVISGSTLISVTGTTAITSTTVWQDLHINISRSSATACKIYVNGTDDTAAGASTSASTIDNTGSFIFGANGALTVFCQDAKDSFAFTKTLSTTDEITALYNAGAGRMYDGNNGLAENGLSTFKSNLISWWGMNEEDGTRYDAKGTNHLAQAFVNIVDPTTLNGGFETIGTNGGLSSGVSTATRLRATNISTIVTASAHGLSSTNVVTITGMTDTTFNATNVAVTVLDATTFTYANTGSDVLVGADTGGRVATDVFGSWLETTAGSSTVNAETSAPYAGTYACRLDVDSSNSNAQVTQAILTVGKKYKVTLYAKASAASGVSMVVSDSNSTQLIQALTDSYVLYTFYFTASAVNFRLGRSSAASKSIFIDNVTLISTEVQSAAGIAAGLSADSNSSASVTGLNYLTANSNATIQFGAYDWEIGGWINPNTIGTTMDIVAKGAPEFYLYTTGSKFGVVVNSTAVLANAFGTISVNNWYFVRVWFNSTTGILSISVNNGTANTGSVTTNAGTTALTFGKSIGNGAFNGRLDGFYKINRILSAGEVTSIFNNGKGVKSAALPSTIKSDSTLSFWNLDEYSSGAAAVTRNDSAANANHLTDSGTVASGQGVNYFEGAVSKWVDASPNANNFIQTTQANKLLYRTNQINGLPVITGDGLTKIISNTADKIGTGDITFFTVIKPKGWGGGTAGRIIENSKFRVTVASNGSIVSSSDSSKTASSDASVIALNTTAVVIITRKSSGATTIYINGSMSGAEDQDAGTPAAGTPTTIMNNSFSTRGFDGDIAILGIAPSILTAGQISTLNSYLENKYAL